MNAIDQHGNPVSGTTDSSKAKKNDTSSSVKATPSITHPAINQQVGVGILFLGAVAVIALADTKAAPLAVAFLAAAAWANLPPLLDKKG